MKNRFKNVMTSLAIGALMCAAPTAFADNVKNEPDTAKDKAANNTDRNRPERQAGEPTAEQQKNNKSDLEITRLIRRAIVTDKSLSISAHNIKIITQNGAVTLKSPVRSEQEKQTIEQKAIEITGKANVKCEIEITPK